jgi:hypothetical protein
MTEACLPDEVPSAACRLKCKLLSTRAERCLAERYDDARNAVSPRRRLHAERTPPSSRTLALLGAEYFAEFFTLAGAVGSCRTRRSSQSSASYARGPREPHPHPLHPNLVRTPPGFPSALLCYCRHGPGTRQSARFDLVSGPTLSRPCTIYLQTTAALEHPRSKRQDGALTRSGTVVPSGKRAMGVGLQPPQNPMVDPDAPLEM